MGVLVARFSGGPDPRTIGSGRTGGTNTLRALGRKWAVVVVTGDLLKGIIPVLLARAVTGGDPLAEVLCGGAAVAGAIWSVFVGFRSGRGVGTGVGTMLVIQPVAVLLATPVFVGRDPADPLRLARVAARVGRDVPGDAAGPAGRPGDAAPLRAVLRGRRRARSGSPTPTTSTACCTARSASSTWACSPGSARAERPPESNDPGRLTTRVEDHAGSAGRGSARTERIGTSPAGCGSSRCSRRACRSSGGRGPGPPCRRTSRWR